MQTGVRQTDRGGNPFEVVVGGIWGQLFPYLVAEYKAVILPKRTGFQPCLCLLDFVPPQNVHHKGSGGNGPALTITAWLRALRRTP